jgi:SAM-dependent methyltransferase
MATSKEHYERVLSPVYAWMLGGFAAAVERNAAFFERRRVSPRGSGRAVDLGAGCGFQSIPLARLGFDVTAIDMDRQLLDELCANSTNLQILTIEADLREFGMHLSGDVELAVCMTDTLLHLESRDDVRQLMSDVFDALEPGGQFILTFRDLTQELTELDRLIPVRCDPKTLFTCFLEYEPEFVKVHDLVYSKEGDRWDFKKSFYRKLRLSEQWVSGQATKAGFAEVESDNANGLITIVATKSPKNQR